jgi:hypothetical protein
LLLQKVSVLRHMLRVILDMVAQVQTVVGCEGHATETRCANGLNAIGKMPVFYLHSGQGYR